MTEIQIPENAEEKTPVLWCQSKWHDMTHLAQVFYTCSGVDFFPHLRYAVLTTLGSLNLANI